MSRKSGFQLVDDGWAICGRHSFQFKISAVEVIYNQILFILKYRDIDRNICHGRLGSLCAIIGSLGLAFQCSVQVGKFETMSSIWLFILGQNMTSFAWFLHFLTVGHSQHRNVSKVTFIHFHFEFTKQTWPDCKQLRQGWKELLK